MAKECWKCVQQVEENPGGASHKKNFSKAIFGASCHRTVKFLLHVMIEKAQGLLVI